jgi:hypothetical protein
VGAWQKRIANPALRFSWKVDGKPAVENFTDFEDSDEPIQASVVQYSSHTWPFYATVLTSNG